jgi:hypothetical protein
MNCLFVTETTKNKTTDNRDGVGIGKELLW